MAPLRIPSRRSLSISTPAPPPGPSRWKGTPWEGGNRPRTGPPPEQGSPLREDPPWKRARKWNQPPAEAPLRRGGPRPARRPPPQKNPREERDGYPRRSGAGRWDVVVEAEHVARVVHRLDPSQTFEVLRLVRRTHVLPRVLAVHEVQQPPPGAPRPERPQHALVRRPDLGEVGAFQP